MLLLPMIIIMITMMMMMMMMMMMVMTDHNYDDCEDGLSTTKSTAKGKGIKRQN